MRGAIRPALAALPIVVASACQGSEPVPGQTLVHVTTDLQVPIFVDTLRIDALDAEGRLVMTRSQPLPDPSDWPTSFGVLGTGRTVRLRLRAFRGDRVRTDATGAVDPIAEYSIDRLVDVTPPLEGIEHVGVLLSGDCVGSIADSHTSATCASDDSGAAVGASPTDRLVGPASQPPRFAAAPGSWIGHRSQPCAREPRADSGLDDEEVCIPGGAFFLGDFRVETIHSPGSSPARLVRISPFLLDRYEVTVARFNDALAHGFTSKGVWYDDEGARPNERCMLSGMFFARHRPMNCIDHVAAQAFCEFEGGSLPTEAQWEYAGVGREEGRVYPWGNEVPTCWSARFGMSNSGMGDHQCWESIPTHLMPDRVGSTNVDSGLDDESRDGVRDLAGNVAEWTLDRFVPYGEECWATGAPLIDPRCPSNADPDAVFVLRGGDYNDDDTALRLSRRSLQRVMPSGGVYVEPRIGFRCARPALP